MVYKNKGIQPKIDEFIGAHKNIKNRRIQSKLDEFEKKENKRI